MFHKMPFILLGVILGAVFLNSWIPEGVQASIYALGLTIKTVIMFLLPIVIFGLLFKTAAHLAKGATTVILLLMAAICCSNFISTMISGHIGMIVYHFDLSIALPQDSAGLQPAWTFTLPKWISNAQAMFAGLVLGILFKKASRVIDKIDKTVDVILKILLVAMPFFIAGFAMKLAHDGVILNIIRDYAQIFGVVAISIVVYLTLIYLVATGFNAKKFWSSLRNMIPAGVAGFGAMSSAAAMPLTIIGAEKNSSRPEIARAVVPATVNIHLIGDCIAIPIFAFAVLKNFGVAQPDLLAYLTFAMYFVMAKFSVAAIPGGGILVMLPVLESCLGFNAEMLSMITALYVLFDPVTSCANVLGNGGFAMLFSKLISKKSKEIA